MLYFRQILIMLVSLYTVRAVLETLGAEDYGIYNVVAGVVTMFGFFKRFHGNRQPAFSHL
jgi:O-antigen/teichoic acid export membrane protein